MRGSKSRMFTWSWKPKRKGHELFIFALPGPKIKSYFQINTLESIRKKKRWKYKLQTRKYIFKTSDKEYVCKIKKS